MRKEGSFISSANCKTTLALPESTIPTPKKSECTDKYTLSAVEWDWFWNQLQPLSILGKQVKQQLAPYRKGEERNWEIELELCKKVDQLGTKNDQQQLITAMKQLPDPAPFLSLLEKGEVGDQGDWFTLKQFIQGALIIIEHFRVIDASLVPLIKVLAHVSFQLGSEEQALSLDKHNSVLAGRQREYFENQQELYGYRKDRRERVEKELANAGVAMRKNGRIYLSTNDKKGLEACRSHPGLRETNQTPFEVIFNLAEDHKEQLLLTRAELLQRDIERLERETLETFAQVVRPQLSQLRCAAVKIGLWDWRRTKWEWKKANDLVWPTLGTSIELEKARYLPLERKLGKEGRTYAPLSIQLRYGCTVFAGMNMGGKSVALKTIASLCLLAHYALPVPASMLQTPLFKGIRLISGDQQSIQQELSTFGAEMDQLARAWEEADHLLLFDELARGTNPTEGEALVFAVASQLAQLKKHTAVLVTHFTFKERIHDAHFYQVGSLDEMGQVTFEISAITQGQVPMHALFMARKLGVSPCILQQAERYLSRSLEPNDQSGMGQIESNNEKEE